MQLGGIDINLILSLRALLRERNVTRAAKIVGLGQSSMSHALARLRAHFGDALMVRVGRNLVLTERARALIGPVEEAISQLEGVFLERQRFDPATSDRVFTIASTDNLCIYILPRLMQILKREAPGVDIRVRQLTADWELPLQNGELDIKLGRKYRVAPSLRSQDLFEERFICVVAADHPAPSKKLTLRQYAGLRHLAVSTASTEPDLAIGYTDAIMARHGIRRRVVLTVPHFLVAPFVVADSDLALTASERLLAPFVLSLRLRIIELPMKLGTYKLTQVWSDRSASDEGHAWLRSAIARAAL